MPPEIEDYPFSTAHNVPNEFENYTEIDYQRDINELRFTIVSLRNNIDILQNNIETLTSSQQNIYDVLTKKYSGTIQDLQDTVEKKDRYICVLKSKIKNLEGNIRFLKQKYKS